MGPKSYWWQPVIASPNPQEVACWCVWSSKTNYYQFLNVLASVSRVEFVSAVLCIRYVHGRNTRWNYKPATNWCHPLHLGAFGETFQWEPLSFLVWPAGEGRRFTVDYLCYHSVVCVCARVRVCVSVCYLCSRKVYTVQVTIYSTPLFLPQPLARRLPLHLWWFHPLQLAPVVFFLSPTGTDTGLTLEQLVLCGGGIYMSIV